MTPRRAAIAAAATVLALTAASACTDSSSSPSVGSSTGIDSTGPTVTDGSPATDPDDLRSDRRPTRSSGARATTPRPPTRCSSAPPCRCRSITPRPTASTSTSPWCACRPANSDDRVGAILFNPGGPGGSGFDYIAQGGTTIVESLGLDDFDLIGFDPRGVDRSNGLRCLTDAEQDATQYLDETPDTPDEQAALDAANDQFEAACIAEFGDTLRHYSTDETARDMDAIRAGLGDDQISYLGISYGTYLGATYATLFPDRVRAMVLDSAFEPTGDTIEQEYTTQLVGFEEAFNNWAAWCEGAAECAFRSDDVGAAWDELSAQLDATPVTADDGRDGQPDRVQRGHHLGAVQRDRLAGAGRSVGRCARRRRRQRVPAGRSLRRPFRRRHVLDHPAVGRDHPLRQRHRRRDPRRPGGVGGRAPGVGATVQPRHHRRRLRGFVQPVDARRDPGTARVRGRRSRSW